MNIVDVITSQLSGHMGRLSSLLGENESTTQSAVGAVVPTLLASLAGMAKNNDGAQKLTSVLNNFDPKSASMEQPSSLMSVGTKMLGSLFGGGDALSSVTGALSSYSGMGSGMMKNLLGYISPLVLGVIANHFKGNASPQGLQSFFSEQKENIASAMPAGFSLPKMEAPAAAYAGAAPAAHATGSRWVAPLLVLALLGGLYYWWNNSHSVKGPEPVAERRQPTAATPKPKTEPEPIETAAPSGDFSKVGNVLSETYSGLGDTLSTVKDASTAEAALPALKRFDDRVENLNSIVDKMPEGARSALKSVNAEHLGKFKDQVGKLLSNPAIAKVLKPVLDHILSGLTSLG
jgi:hypothetical protein